MNLVLSKVMCLLRPYFFEKCVRCDLILLLPALFFVPSHLWAVALVAAWWRGVVSRKRHQGQDRDCGLSASSPAAACVVFARVGRHTAVPPSISHSKGLFVELAIAATAAPNPPLPLRTCTAYAHATQYLALKRPLR